VHRESRSSGRVDRASRVARGGRAPARRRRVFPGQQPARVRCGARRHRACARRCDRAVPPTRG
jgi:hypothetical protein